MAALRPNTVFNFRRLAATPLSNIQVRTAKPQDKPFKLTDSGGLYLLINPTGSKLWRYNYRFAGKRKTLALGQYPDISLAEARKRHAEARQQVAQNIDPSAIKKTQKIANQEHAQNTFEAIFREWHSKQSNIWSDSHIKRVSQLLERDVLPWIGKQPIADISPHDLLKILKRIQERGAIETAHRAQQLCGQIFRYGIASLRCNYNPAADLRGALSPVKDGNFPAITKPEELAVLLRDVKAYRGSFIVRCALQLWSLVI